MTASSVTARLLSLIILVLSLAPLGSFYVLFCSLRGDDSLESSQEETHNNANNNNLAQLLQSNPNASLSELWAAVLLNGWTNFHLLQQEALGGGYSISSTTNTGATTATQQIAATISATLQQQQQQAVQHHHLTVLLPWLISIVLGVTISVASFLWGRNQQQRIMMQQQQQDGNNFWTNTTDQQKKQTQERRRRRVLLKLQGFQKQLEPTDCVEIVNDDDATTNATTTDAAADDATSKKKKEENTDANTSAAATATAADVTKDGIQYRFVIPFRGEETSTTTAAETSQSAEAAAAAPTLQWKLLRPGISLAQEEREQQRYKGQKRWEREQWFQAKQAWRKKIIKGESPPPLPPLPKDNDDNDKPINNYRNVPESCVICMHPYAVGDHVVWSPNTACVHCFHEHCILPWLIRKTTKQQLCPCCRQPFLRPKFVHPSSS